MDGLASLAAAADLLGEYDTSKQVHSPSKQKRGASNPETPKKKRAKKAPTSPLPVRSPSHLLQDQSPEKDLESPMPVATSIDLERHGLGNESLLSSITQRFSANVLHWCTYEWFYTTLDREYFNENEFKACLQCLGVDEATHLARSEWSAVRTIMGSTIGRPRRFSPSFLKSERDKLHNYRENVRALQADQSVTEQDFRYDVHPSITVGDCVTAYHAESGLLLRGQVLTLETCFPEGTPSYRVQFEYPVMFTGIVRDEDLALHGELVCVGLNKIDGSEADMTKIGSLDALGMNTVGSDGRRQWEHAATLQYFLERKEYLLESLKVLNNLAEQELLLRAQSENSDGDANAAESQFTERFLQQHQWVIDNVMRSDNIIAQLLQQLDNDTSLYGQDVIRSSPPLVDGTAIDALWAEELDKLKSVTIPAQMNTEQNPTGLLLGGDPAQKGASSERVSHEFTTDVKPLAATEVEDMSSALDLYKVCVCCLALLKKYQLEEFCRPKELCEFLVSKVDGYNDLVPMRNVVQKIEAICFGLS